MKFSAIFVFVLIGVLVQDSAARPSQWVMDMILEFLEPPKPRPPTPVYLYPVQYTIPKYPVRPYIVPQYPGPRYPVPANPVPTHSVQPISGSPNLVQPISGSPNSVPPKSVLPHQVPINSPQSPGHQEPGTTWCKNVNIGGLTGHAGDSNGSQHHITIGMGGQPKVAIDKESDNCKDSKVNFGGVDGHTGDSNGSQHDIHIGVIYPVPKGNNV